MADLEIIGAPQSNYVWVCRAAAAEKGVAYKLVEARPHTPDVDGINPFGRIPAMRHGSVKLFESKAICSYIDRAFPGPALIPTDAVAAAETEQWISAVNTTIDATWMRRYVINYVFPGTPDGSPNRAAIDAALPAMEKQFALMERAVASGHLAGNRFTLADINLIPIIHYMQRFPESQKLLAAHQGLLTYYARHIERPSIKAALPPPPPAKS